MEEMEEGERDLRDSVHSLEKELRVGAGFVERLFDEPSDWSFIIKVHALSEAAMTHLVTIALRREELRDVIARLDMGDQRRGKLVFAERLDAIDKDLAGFLRALGRLRNQYAHGIKNVSLRIEDLVNSFPTNERDTFWRQLAYFAPSDEVEVRGRMVNAVAFAKENPRLAVWFSVMNAVAAIQINKDLALKLQEMERVVLSTMGALLSRQVSG